MSRIKVNKGLVTFSHNGATYYVKQNFAPSIQVWKAEVPARQRRGIPETFFSNGPVERVVSMLGAGRCNVVSVKLAHDFDLTSEEKALLLEVVGSDFYFSRSAADYGPETLPQHDPEIALGYQVVLDTIVRNWDDGDDNRLIVNGIPVWYDFGASLDPRCQNVFRFIMKLEEARGLGRVSALVTYFMDYTRRRSQILKRAVSTFKEVTRLEIRTILKVSEVQIPAFFGEYIANNIKQAEQDIDIIRGAFLRELVRGREGYL